MTDKEIATLEKRVDRAKKLQKFIKYAEKRIETIQVEISYKPDGTKLNVREDLKPELPFQKIIPLISEEDLKNLPNLPFDERESLVTGIIDSEIISLGNFIISILQKRVKRWKAELKKL